MKQIKVRADLILTLDRGIDDKTEPKVVLAVESALNRLAPISLEDGREVFLRIHVKEIL